MPSRARRWLEANAQFLFKEAMPVWLTILASVVAALVAAIGTYQIAPAINRQYQIDEARSAHIAKTTSDLNVEIIALSQKVRRLNDALLNEGSDAASLRQDCLDQITKLQWMLVDLQVVLQSEEDSVAIGRLSVAIGDVRDALELAVDETVEERLIQAMDRLGRETRGILDRLYSAASLK